MKKVGPGLLRACRFAALLTVFSFCLPFFSLNSATASNSNAVTLLPPADFNGAVSGVPPLYPPCTTPGILQWDGATSKHQIACAPGFFGSTATRDARNNVIGGNLFQGGPISFYNSVTVTGNGARLGNANSTVVWANLGQQCHGQGGNIAVDMSGGLHCCPLGQIAVSVSNSSVSCGAIPSTN